MVVCSLTGVSRTMGSWRLIGFLCFCGRFFFFRRLVVVGAGKTFPAGN